MRRLVCSCQFVDKLRVKFRCIQLEAKRNVYAISSKVQLYKLYYWIIGRAFLWRRISGWWSLIYNVIGITIQ